MGLIATTLKSTPVVGQVYTFVDIAKNVTQIADPVEAGVSGVRLVLEKCLPPPLKLSVECVLLFAEIGGAIALSSNPVTGAFSWSIAIASASRVLMKKL